MSKSNPTTRADAPNYEVRDGIIYRYEPMDISEAFGALSDVKNPICGFRDADFQPWQEHRLDYVIPRAAEPFRVKGIGGSLQFQQCARITAEDPRKVPEGVPELPEPWLAYVGRGPLKPSQRPHEEGHDLWGLRLFDANPKWASDCEGSAEGWHYAIDVRTAFAREHFPEYVQAIGYPIEEPVPERIQLTDTQLLDKLAETEHTLPDGRQFWQVFTDRGDPQMTVREAIEAWGADE